MELNYKQFGQGDPLVILHGLFGTLDNWQTIARKLGEHFTVFIIDQRNHGKSPHLPVIDYPTMAEDLKEFLESKWVYNAHIMGHSMGGKTAMQFAMDYPDMVDKLVVVDIAPKRYVGGHQLIFDALFALDLKTIENRKQADAQLAERIDSFGVRQFLLKNLTRQKDGNYAWKMNLDVIHHHYQDILGEIEGETQDMPTLFIGGGNSKYIQEEDHADIQSLFANATIQTIPDAGHWVHAEQPQMLMDTVLKFLK